MKERIVVTGWGSLTAAGSTVEDTWQNIKAGQSGIDTINAWDVTDWEYAQGGQIKNLEPKQIVDRKLLKLLSHHDVIGLGAVNQALTHSQLFPYRETLTDPTEFNERTGVYVASPGTKFHQQYDFFPLLTQAEGSLQRFGAELSGVVHPMWLLRTLPNNVLAYTAIQHGFKGANQNIINHSVGGIQAILEASYAILRGNIDRAVVVGYDAMLEPQAQIYYSALGVVSKTGLKPFDAKRDGTILAEGAGAVLLETLSSAKARGATIYGEILGGDTTSEAVGIFPIREDGDGLARVIQNTLTKVQIDAEEIGMITAHANGTVISDAIEAEVFAKLFSELPVTGFKWSLGHTFAAVGVIETILTLLSLKENIVPGIATLAQKANDCSKINVSAKHQPISKHNALVINRGFSSVNSCLAVASFVE